MRPRLLKLAALDPQAAQPLQPVSLATGRDREFLPAALEILEAPPSPLPVALMLIICGFVALALAWSMIGRLDIHASAPGKIETLARAKIIQPLEPGKIAAIHVDNGAHVKAGDRLLDLDPAEMTADANAARQALNASLAEIARRRFAIQTVQTVRRAALDDPLMVRAIDPRVPIGAALAAADLDITWDQTIPEEFRLREQAVLIADFGQLAETLVNLDQQIAQKEATRQRLNMSIAFQDQLMETLNARVDMRKEAIARDFGTKINLYDAKEDLQRAQSAMASDQGQLIETAAALRELQSQQSKALSQFTADNANKLADAARKADEAREQLAKATARLSHTRLEAPIDGIVQQLAVTTLGQVVTTGQQLLMVTPDDGALKVEALVANLDIGFVKLGQEAVIKIDAFPFTRFGVLQGRVMAIASEAIDENTAKRALANAAASANTAAAPATAPGQPDSFVFPVTIALDQASMKIGETNVPLAAGMTASVEIRTGSRTVIDYLFSPLAKVASEALRER